jgi:uncharacterized protein
MIEILVGLLGGLLIGATGIGAGLFIAPLLLVDGYSPATAVGAGLVSLVLSKLTAAEFHRQMGHLPGRTALPLVFGGLAGVALTWLGTRTMGRWDLAGAQLHTVIKTSLGIGLLLIAVLLLVRRKQNAPATGTARFPAHPAVLFATGVAIAIIVALTSVGAGSLLIPALLIITQWEPAELTAAANFYGAVVGLASAFVYLNHHSLNFPLIGLIAIGLLPGVVMGTRLSHLVSRPLLARGTGLIVGYLGCALLLSRS